MSHLIGSDTDYSLQSLKVGDEVAYQYGPSCTPQIVRIVEINPKGSIGIGNNLWFSLYSGRGVGFFVPGFINVVTDDTRETVRLADEAAVRWVEARQSELRLEADRQKAAKRRRLSWTVVAMVPLAIYLVRVIVIVLGRIANAA